MHGGGQQREKAGESRVGTRRHSQRRQPRGQSVLQQVERLAAKKPYLLCCFLFFMYGGLKHPVRRKVDK